MPMNPAASDGSGGPVVCVLAPAPLLTVTVEAGLSNGTTCDEGEIHLHAGGQGWWIARMLVDLELEVVLCASVAGETGTVLRALLADSGMTVQLVDAVGAERCLRPRPTVGPAARGRDHAVLRPHPP